MVLDEAKRLEILRLAREGKCIQEITQTVGVVNQTIHYHCSKASITLRRGRATKQWTQDQINECLLLYRSGMSQRQIQLKMGVTGKATAKYLKLAGEILRNGASHGDKNYFWRTGQHTDRDGYVLVYAPDHPHCSHSNKVRRHRLVMEQKLGRYLEPKEVVDHINGVKGDDRPENLQVFANNAAHLHSTLKGRTPKWTAEGRQRLLASGKAYRLRRKLGRSILGAHRLQKSHAARCKAGTCPLYETRQAEKREQRLALYRAWRKRGTVLQVGTAA